MRISVFMGNDQCYANEKQDGKTTLNVMLSHSLSLCTLPRNRKMARVTPVYKGCRLRKHSSYRRVALLSILSKVMGSLVRDDLRDYLLLINFFQPNNTVTEKDTLA